MPDDLPHPVARLRLPGGFFALFSEQKIFIGRSPESDVVLNDPKISRAHAQVEWNGFGFSISDLGSVNGTFVNSARLVSTSRQLRDGDEISLGPYNLVYEIVRVEIETASGCGSFANSTLDRGNGPGLRVCAGPDTGQIYPLWGEAITIGRSSWDATWEIRLSDRSVSRPHARLTKAETGYVLHDLKSVNGTYVNESLVSKPVQLHSGDMIRVGETSLLLL